MRLNAITSWIALVLGLASVPAPIHAQGQAAANANANAFDFQCFTLLRQRRAAMLADTQMQPAQRAEVVNNLTIIGGYYAGRLSMIASGDVVTGLAAARTALDSSTLEQRDMLATQCANTYLALIDVLGSAAE